MSGSILSSDLIIEGDIHAGANELLIQCEVRGDIYARQLIVGQQGRIDGKIKAGVVTIEGSFSGQLECDRLTIAEDARVEAQMSVKGQVGAGSN